MVAGGFLRENPRKASSAQSQSIGIVDDGRNGIDPRRPLLHNLPLPGGRHEGPRPLPALACRSWLPGLVRSLSGLRPPDTAYVTRYRLPLAGSGAGQGYATFQKSMTGVPSALVGTTLHGQWLVVDPQATGGLAATPALQWTIL